MSIAILALSLSAGAALLAAPDPRAGAVTAEVVEVVEKPLSGTTALPGELRPFREVDVYARVSGFVETVAVDRGSRVQRGDLLAAVTAPELDARIAEAQARVTAIEAQRIEAEARLAAAESTLARLRQAAATPGVVAGNDLVQAEKAVEADRSRIAAIAGNLEAARAAMAAAEQMRRYLRVTADFDGVVTERLVHEGSLVGPDSKSAAPMFRLVQTDRLRLVVAVPEALVASIRRGARMEFTVPAYPGEAFSGLVARPALSLDPKTRTMPVELDVANRQGKLAPGMYAEVAWPAARGRASLLVPATAVKATTERIFVIRVSGGVAEWVDVRRGVTDGKLLEVFGNLKPGDKVLLRATDEIRPGTPIRPAGR
jgi:membrane fusion protein (multidrug efflux system)